MKKSLFLALSLFVLAPGAQAADPVDQRHAKESQLEKDLNHLSKQVDDLKTRSQSAGSQSRSAVDRQVRNLDNGLSVARERLLELRGATSAQWETLRLHMDSVMNNLQKRFRRAESYLTPTKAKQ